MEAGVLDDEVGLVGVRPAYEWRPEVLVLERERQSRLTGLPE